jgi:hypothetical protein
MEGELKTCVTTVTQQLNMMSPFLKHENRIVWVRYLPHALVALEHSLKLFKLIGFLAILRFLGIGFTSIKLHTYQVSLGTGLWRHMAGPMQRYFHDMRSP